MASRNNYRYETRLFVLISSFTWVLTFAFFMLQYSREKEYKIESLNARLQIYNTELLNTLSSNRAITPEYIRGISPIDSLRVTVIGLDGKVRYDNDGDSVYNNHSTRREFQDAVRKGQGYTVCRVSETNNREYFYSATKGDSVVVRTALPYNMNLSASLSVDWIYGGIVIVIAIIVNIIAWFAIRKIGKTVESLRDFATRAEEGKLDASISANFPQDELGEISSHIVNMYIKQQQILKERDENMNAAIFEEQEKVRIKHQLTNNINHEIKTPVHAIQACLETMISNREQLDQKTLYSLADKAYAHVKRLCSLLRDISVITRISEAPSQIELSPVNVSQILEEIKSDTEIYPAEKRMRLNINVPDKLIINGNASLIDSIFRNLVNNSMAYSGGRDIYITMTNEMPDYYEFEFADNGIGVETEHLQRLFERFYRVDAGRSRKMGGTGLGLAIVKNAVLFHQGQISVSNRRTGGLQFTFTLHK